VSKHVLWLALLLAASLALAQEPGDAGPFMEMYNSSGDAALPKIRQALKSGTPMEKEQVLYLFMERQIVELVPDLIEALLDATVSPRHEDTGWASVHHQAATALCLFAQRFDGKNLEARGRQAYSFFDDAGIGSASRRKEVHDNWARWWKQNETAITGPVSVPMQKT